MNLFKVSIQDLDGSVTEIISSDEDVLSRETIASVEAMQSK